MKNFKHHNARTLKQAAALLAQYGGKAKVNAGGTDLLGNLRENSAAEYPEAVINIKNIRGLSYVKPGSRELRIGALTTLADLLKSPAVRQDYALLAEAAHEVASPNLRNMATVGGNLAQDVRCWYYRYPQQIGGPIVCLRKGGRTCSALQGDNRYHSIFGAAAAEERRCAGHCPAHIDIPGYLRHVRNGDFAQAAAVLMKYNPIPAITGRVCPIFCEPQCNRGEFDNAVAIHSVERGVGDFILDHAAQYFAPPTKESGKRVAIVGSGPAGMTAAFYLRQSGHSVTVFERMPEAGGMLLYSIPPYRLPKDVVRRQVQALQSMGIQFEMGSGFGAERSVHQLLPDFDAVFLAGGTWKSIRLGLPGEDAPNVFQALEFLRGINSGERTSPGRKVIVIGGGSVAIDAARTARRLGAEEVHLVCLETRDLQSKDRMPALDAEIAEAEEEGIRIHPSLGIREFVLENGRAVAIRTRQCTSVRDQDGRFNPHYDDSLDAEDLLGDSIIVAIGQANDQTLAMEASNAFGPAKLFCGGDMSEGPSTVIQAVASALKSVREIASALSLASPAEEDDREPEYSESYFENIPRTAARVLPPEERVRNFDIEDVPGLSAAEVEMEAKRCVSCGCLAVGPSDLAIALVALDATIVTSRRMLPAKAFFTASAASSTILEKDELIKEVRIPKPPKGARQAYRKFTLRKPLDFAVVSVASILSVKDGICSDARITLGAVAPAPWRAKAAEAVLKGKPLSSETAEEASALAVRGAAPLSMNAYKAEIARVLVKRTILGVPD